MRQISEQSDVVFVRNCKAPAFAKILMQMRKVNHSVKIYSVNICQKWAIGLNFMH